MTPLRRIAITGLGIISPCGLGWQTYWKAALAGNSHIGYLKQGPSENGFPVKLGGRIPDFEPSSFIKQRKSLKLMSREIQLAVAASYLAIADSGIQLEESDRTRFGISLGTGIINNDLDEVGIAIRNSIGKDGKFGMKKFGAEGIKTMYPLWFLKYLPNMPACHISIAHGISGPSNTITTSSAAGAQAIGEACGVIRRGDADIMLAGSTDSKINAMGISRFQLLGLLSYQSHVPKKAYRPFDKCHDGIVLGEGVGIVMLEEWEHAKKRGASIYAELLGYGSASDYNYNPSVGEDFTGKRLAMGRALENSHTSPSEVDFVFANGSGIPQEDVQEAQAISSLFGSSVSKLHVTGVKPITGHLVYGSAGVEVAAAVLSLHESVLPPLINLENPAIDCELPFVKDHPKSYEAKTLLFNSFGFGGQNAALVLRKSEV